RLLVLTSFEELAGVDPALLERLAGHMIRPVKPSALQRALTHAAGEPPAPEPSPAPAAAPAAPVRVLIVEDNPVNQHVVRLHLQKLGYQTAVAQDGEEAVAAIAAAAYDLILMDCQMPRMDGFTATRHIREAELAAGGHVPIVAMTAHAMAGDREACLAAGMDDYLSKPITAAVLRATLRRWLPDAAPEPPPGPAEPGAPPPGLTPAELDGAVLEGLRELNSDDEPDIVTMLIEIFFNSAPALLAQIREQAARQDGPALEIAAHSLKGSASNLGARELARLCKDLEYAGRDGRFELVPAQLVAAEREFARVRLALERERQLPEDPPPAA
ncbi:MAG TPA: response regulator, partial [Herpetosiphonaceae bacterium]